MSNERDELPEGWEWKPLGEACQVNVRDRRVRELSDDLPVTFVPMAAVDAEQGTIATPQVRPLKEVRKGFTPFVDGDVIFAKITPCMENGKAAIARGLTNSLGFGSTEFHVLRPTDVVRPEWVFYFVRRQEFRNEAKENFSGTAGQLRVPDAFVRSAEIPVAPLDEQHRIVARIEGLFAESRTAREALDGVPALIKRFRQAVLAKAFRGELTERDPSDEPASVLLARIREERRVKSKGVKSKREVEPEPPDINGLPELSEGWEWTNIDALSYHVTSGSRGWAKHYADDGDLFIRVGDFNRLSISLDLKKVAFVDAPHGLEAERTRLQSGDLLITMTADVGMVGVVTDRDLGLKAAYINQHVGLVRPVSVDVISYVAYALASEFGQKQFGDKQYGATKIGLNLDDLKSLVIPLAPLSEQRRIVAKIEALFAQADAIEEAVHLARQRAEKVDQAILARAFRGEL